ncbi:MAG: FKBP-type peptidyl-prolyl cis-trans isomerase [Xanthomonadales bacterium]|nr:FKBP-type peptidyl-prolyl cis-trans isomerase [Gammaproteobacteria bacterium]MBT8053752.1 FKBP-type peptidyl-prolyl cis-trans isomerase [Gammaproteobacteria bacterium]NND57637.1 FKBP-type peptidyl-prolyl cis-trans isomerase [Xanthomonadales bacterium]
MLTVNCKQARGHEMKFVATHKIAMVLALCMVTITGAWSAEQAFRNAAGGLRIKDLQTGQGNVAIAGQVATIHFVGWIDERGVRGREIYNSHARGEPVSFVIGTDGVMQGWNEGVLGMKPGGKRMLLVPPGMAYGKRKVENIPENASLMFRIELVSLEEQ